MTNLASSSLLKQRRAGVLLHISSLPSAFYVGDIGVEAFRFVDFLHEIGASVWQTLPINMTHADHSPYQCLSAHAGNPDFISLEALQAKRWLSKADLVAFGLSKVRDKSGLIAKAYLAFTQKASAKQQQSFTDFCENQADWLEDFALFLVLRKKFNGAGWNQWPQAYKTRDASSLKAVAQSLAESITVIKFTQYLFFSQWLALKAHAKSKHVYLFGDIPIFVAYDSADVWAKPHLFKLDAHKEMQVVAGVPPDYFSATGQRWGNPHYDWDAMAQDGFAWWISRMKTQYALFDIVRIDHFRGLQAAWEIPATEATAMHGEWVLAPGEALLTAIIEALPNIHLVAEDLGIITAEVDALRHRFHLPGMKILHFAFGGDEDNPYLPHHIEADSVVYTGTHDNDTTVGWYQALDEKQRWHVNAYLQSSRDENHDVQMPDDLIELAFSTKANLAVIPMQDILALDSQHRMNTPGTIVGNWLWRFNWQELQPQQQSNMVAAIVKSGRQLS